MQCQNRQTQERNRRAIFFLSNIYFFSKRVCFLKAAKPLFVRSKHSSYAYPLHGNNNILHFKRDFVKEKSNFSLPETPLPVEIALKSIADQTHPTPPPHTLISKFTPFLALKGKKRLMQNPLKATFQPQAHLENNTQPPPIPLYHPPLYHPPLDPQSHYILKEELLCSV